MILGLVLPTIRQTKNTLLSWIHIHNTSIFYNPQIHLKRSHTERRAMEQLSHREGKFDYLIPTQGN